MRRLSFGRIEILVVRNGEPVFGPPPRLVREIKFGSERSAPPKPASTDFELKSQVKELFDLFAEIGDGVVEVLEVRHGLPFRAVIAESIAAIGGA